MNIDFGDDGIFPCRLAAVVVLKSHDDPTHETYQLLPLRRPMSPQCC